MTLIPIVIEKTGRGERAYDIFSRLLNDRIVFIGGGIGDEMANVVIAQLLFLANEDSKADVSIYVNSPGGSVTSGLAIVDTMRFVPCDVATYIIGQASSMGSVIACSGTKGKRYTLPYAENLMHQPLLGGVLEGQATDLEIEARHILRMRETIYKIYAEATGQPVSRIADDCERNKWLNAHEMAEYGLVDRVLDRLPRPAGDGVSLTKSSGPVVLIIRDGWGENPHPEHDSFNAVKLARTPVADALMRDYPTTLIKTSGEDVGLPETAAGPTMGNSEVGHQNIGAGRIVDQEVMRLTRAIRDGSFFTNATLRGAFAHAARTGGNVHLMGLVSDGLVHSDLQHLLALIDLAQRERLPADRLFVDAFMDGRDTPPMGGLNYLAQVEAKLKSIGIGRVSTVIGRFFSMDRDHRWERIERAYRCLTAPGGCSARTAAAAITAAYNAPAPEGRRGDEFIEPVQIAGGKPIGDGDAVIFFNFRGDRPRELTKAFVLDDAPWVLVQGGGFARGRKLENLYFATMTGYEKGLPVQVAFEKPTRMENILGQVVSAAKLTQFRCAETEKFPHVTFFFNDYREEPFEGERRLIVPSPKDVTTYDQKPEMSAEGVCAGVLSRLTAADGERLIIVNFANGDMVGHTGVLPAAIKACEVVDECVGRVVTETLKVGGELIVTADHGNAEQMWDPIHECPHTSHTNYLVPLIVAGQRWGKRLIAVGRLADIAPTLLFMLGLNAPIYMTGRNMIVNG